jgi:hypothetical protein
VSSKKESDGVFARSAMGGGAGASAIQGCRCCRRGGSDGEGEIESRAGRRLGPVMIRMGGAEVSQVSGCRG